MSGQSTQRYALSKHLPHELNWLVDASVFNKYCKRLDDNKAVMIEAVLMANIFDTSSVCCPKEAAPMSDDTIRFTAESCDF